MSRVHLARAMRGSVSMIIGMACLTWYGAYVSQQSPSRARFAVADQLAERWRNQPTDRVDIEMAMAEIATDLVGDAPIDLLDNGLKSRIATRCQPEGTDPMWMVDRDYATC